MVKYYNLGDVMSDKIMYFANFNITFGQDFEPMLKHFEDIIYPAFLSGLTRGEKSQKDNTSEADNGPVFSMKNVELKKEPNGEIVLVGNYVKDTMYKVRTNLKAGELVQSPLDVPTAPYSRFIIFLRNHRMILIKNESNSPDIRSFQATVRNILTKYRKRKNDKIEKSKENKPKLPYASVNIVDMKLKEDISQVIDKLIEINKVNLRFFPLNGDNDPRPLANAVRQEMLGMGCDTANSSFNSPKNKNGVKNFLEETTSTGLAISTIKAIDNEGLPVTIKEDNFTSSKRLEFGKDIDGNDDNYLINFAKRNEAMTVTSEENDELYNYYFSVLDNYIKK